ncbi:hypothetical protein GCM10027449_26520 [Sinomonas notoginsengisoli]|uniref:hypothetical protein n=1 Tax=Sinomonas notoginsengisoli TaxID=1457311 RepID=UPI001F337A9F|nr:hypothetical protein [Sinomonas notoginsengisoli]
MAHIPHYPLPPYLHDAVDAIAGLIADPGSASNAVHVISGALGRAYNAGHRDGQLQIRQLAWVVESLESKIAAAHATREPEDAAHG